MDIHRIAFALTAAAAVIAVAAACGASHRPGGTPLTITTTTVGADWVTDGTVKPPNTFERNNRIHYPRTMDGAVMAAIDSQTLLDSADNKHFGDIARDYFAVGDGLTAYLNARRQINVIGAPDKSKLPHIKGFRFLTYTTSAADVEVFFVQPDQSITGLTRHLVWLADNWLVQVPDPNAPDKPMKAYGTLPADMNPLPQT